MQRDNFLRRRLLWLAPQLLGVTLVTFLVVRFLPGNPARLIAGPFATEAQVALQEQRLGLDQPLPVQYLSYVWGVLRGDFGYSWFTSGPVRQDIGQRLPATIELITIALALSLLIMIPLGIWTARRPGGEGRSLLRRGVDGTISIYSLLAGSLADFWLALILIFVFYTTLTVAPAPIGSLDVGISSPERITGFLLIDSVITGNLAALTSYLRHLVLPVATLVFVYGGPILKMTVSSMRDLYDRPFVDNFRAMGLKRSTIRRYVFRNSLPPVATMVGIIYGFLLGGAVLVETVFGLNGIGAYGVQAVLNADYAAVQSFALISALFLVGVYLVVDLVLAWSDPRVRM